VLRALAYFNQHSREMPDGRRFIAYPTDLVGQTNTVALTALTIIDLLRVEPRLPERKELEKQLKGYIQFLLSLRATATPGEAFSGGTFSAYYSTETGMPERTRGGGADNSPYSDGETLLALVKAAKYAGYGRLQPQIIESANTMFHDHFEEEAKLILAQNSNDVTSPVIKGFYQWGAMAYYEIYTSDWRNRHRYGDMAIRMSDWMLNNARITEVGGNTAYSIEGLAVSWEIARLGGDLAGARSVAS
jgi:hypothetical protein